MSDFSIINGLEQTINNFASTVSQIPIVGQTLAGAPQSLASALSLNNSNFSARDMRVRLAALNPNDVYANSPIMSLLNETNGVLFPYTPSISYNQSVDYQTIQLVHSNTDYAAYTRTPSPKFSLNGKFTVQNQREGEYALAVLHFYRTVSKSYFGENDPKAGLPPPVLLFSGYGDFMFNNLRVIMLSHSWTFDDAVDMIDVSISAQPSLSNLANFNLFGFQSLGIPSLAGSSSGGLVRLPSMFTIQCELMVIQTPTRMRQEFNFDSFASGQLMSSGDGWI